MSERSSIPPLSVAEQAALEVLQAGGAARLERPPGSASAALAWGLCEAFPRTWIWVTDGPRALEALDRDLRALAGDRHEMPALFPALESLGDEPRAPDVELQGARLDALRRLRQIPSPRLVVTCIQALQQPTLSPEDLERHRLVLAPGIALRPADLAARLQAAGYEFVAQVQARGEAAVRGGIADAWPPHAEWPLRVEFGETGIESLRQFDPDGQRSKGRLSEAAITPAREAPAGDGARLSDHLPPDAAWVWVEPERLREHAHIYVCAAREAGQPAPPSLEALRASATASLELVATGEAGPGTPPSDWLPLDGVPGTGGSRREGWIEPDRLDAERTAFVSRLFAAASPARPAHFFFDTDAARARFAERFLAGREAPPGVRLHTGALGEGFARGDGAFTAVAESDVYGRRIEARNGPSVSRRRKPAGGSRLSDWAGIEPGELVVHVEHGIGRYLGLYEIVFDGRPQEVLAVEYADAAKLYIPVGQAHLLSRYIGFGRVRPDLHRLGGGRWTRDKQAAERAIRDLAAQLLETQAVRQTRPGHAFPPDSPWQREFEAAFPYVETEDQAHATDEIKRDMEAPRPMDRLLCGDVGFGKTEVAMRAAFKAVLGGKQVAMLVPTTVLAQQHVDTFTTRMAAFPVVVEMLSRFRTRGQQAEVLRRVSEGQVDVVIGTHRLLQPDVRFKDLGLVILDEEQRFGVAHKEALKALRATVDILTLTATPIPRTLYLSLTGARDLSVIQTAPRERLPIETIVAPYDDAVIREAILRELNREGQVFFLHNRVQTIHAARERLRHLMPEARVELAHGQMGEGELADIMHAFGRGEFDVLLCTTIIESGVDIPNVNTILIERADRFGLADLYQLRGRVGRYKHRAYAYLLLPRHGRLFDTARQRIHALRRHSGLGSGFRLALRDLETRGAGNLLGAEQSGHIRSVGFDLYCQLLRRTVAQLQGAAPPPVVEVRLQLDFLELSTARADAARGAVLPESYIEDETQRLEAYRRLAGAATEREVRALAAEWRDRYGPLPAMAGRLLLAARIRIRARIRGLDSVATDGDKLILSRRGDLIQPNGRFPRLRAAHATGRLEEILKFLGRSP